MIRCLTSLFLFLFCQSLFAAPNDLNHLMDTVFATHQFKEVAITADGSHVAWVEQWPLNESQYQNHIFVAASASGAAQRVQVAGSENDHGLTWSPDGKQLAFLGDENGALRLHVFDIASKKVRVVGTITGDLSIPRWSPAGS